MAVTHDDLLAPEGELDPSLFPSDDASALSTRLDAYIAAAAARLAAYPTGSISDDVADAATRAYAYAEAYAAVYRRMAAQPMSTTLADQGSVSYNVQQAREFKVLSDEKRAEFASYLPVAAPDTAAELFARSGAVPTRVSW